MRNGDFRIMSLGVFLEHKAYSNCIFFHPAQYSSSSSLEDVAVDNANTADQRYKEQIC